MLSSYKLPLAFDAVSLKADLERILAKDWVAHFNRAYYEGAWKGLALRSTTGRANQLSTLAHEEAVSVETQVLDRCPYVRQVLAAFECTIPAARLLSLGAGAKILEHNDSFLGGDFGLLRVHIPVTTDSAVEFFAGGCKLVMREGEAWCIDFSLPHHITNGSDRDRVHLIIDCQVNAWLQRLLPSEPDAAKVAVWQGGEKIRAGA